MKTFFICGLFSVLVFGFFSSLKSLSSGLMMMGLLFFSFLIFVFLFFEFKSWVGGIFFLVYMGALLMIFFYVLLLNYKPVFLKNMSSGIFLSVMFALLIFVSGLNNLFKGKFLHLNSGLVKSQENFSLLYSVAFLLFMMWVKTKFIGYSLSSSFRNFM